MLKTKRQRCSYVILLLNGYLNNILTILQIRSILFEIYSIVSVLWASLAIVMPVYKKL